MLKTQLPQDKQQKLNTDTTADTEKDKSRLVIVFDTDADGTCAAWCIWKGFKDDYDDVLLIPQRAGVNEIPSGLTENDTVFLVDRSYPISMLLALSKSVCEVTVIDHHKSFMDDLLKSDITFTERYITSTSVDVLLGNLTVGVDTTHSACMLAHMYVMEHGIDPDTSVNPPWFVSYIEDRDLWQWKLPNSREINAGLSHYGHTFEAYDSYYAAYSLTQASPQFDRENLAKVGNIVLVSNLKIIRSIAHGPTVKWQNPIYQLNGRLEHPTMLIFAVVCCPFMLISDLGDYMLNRTDPEYVSNWKLGMRPDAVLCYNQDATTGEYIYSVRSKQDMLWLAKKYNGAGHPNACGFKSPISPSEILN